MACLQKKKTKFVGTLFRTNVFTFALFHLLRMLPTMNKVPVNVWNLHYLAHLAANVASHQPMMCKLVNTLIRLCRRTTISQTGRRHVGNYEGHWQFIFTNIIRGCVVSLYIPSDFSSLTLKVDSTYL